MRLLLATVGICLGSALVALILSATNVALPTIRVELEATLVQIQWVVNIAAISRASLVATIGRLADMFGRRRVFLVGTVLFVVAALVAGFAPNVEWLIFAMALSGVASATLIAVSQALLAHAFPAGQTGRALAFWSMGLGVGIATGSLLSGSILEVASWRWVFFATIPFAVVAWGLTLLAVDESRDETRSRKIDWIGLLLLVIGVASLVTAIIQGPIWGWPSWQTVTLFALGAVALLTFVAVEWRLAQPLLQLRLFANRRFIAAVATNFCFVCFMLTTFFLVPLFLNLVLGAEPIAIGLIVLALALPVLIAAPLAGRITDRRGPKWQIAFGLLLLIGGSLWMTTFTVETEIWEMVLALLLIGFGWAAMQGSAATAAHAALPKELAGTASGTFIMVGGFGGAIGLAVGGTIVRSVYAAELDGLPSPGAFADGFHAGMWFLFGVSVAALTIVLTVMKRGEDG